MYARDWCILVFVMWRGEGYLVGDYVGAWAGCVLSIWKVRIFVYDSVADVVNKLGPAGAKALAPHLPPNLTRLELSCTHGTGVYLCL